MEATEKPIEITVAANAGVMIRAGNTVILADVLEDAGPYPFDRLPDSVLSQMAEGENPWRNAQYLIFTHEHPDHFAPDLVRRYLSRNTVRRLVLPNRPDKENQDLLSELRESRAPVWAPPDEIGKWHTFVLQKDILLHTACTPGERGVFPVSRERSSPYRELFRPMKTACLMFFHAVSLEGPHRNPHYACCHKKRRRRPDPARRRSPGTVRLLSTKPMTS